ncbi:MAG: hypothetical protein R2681_05390 [Pyrinomonadaceae bacterium]
MKKSQKRFGRGFRGWTRKRTKCKRIADNYENGDRNEIVGATACPQPMSEAKTPRNNLPANKTIVRTASGSDGVNDRQNRER